MDLKDELDPAFKRAEWRLQRVGWGFLALVVALALVGFFGDGPLSDTTAEARQGDASLQVHYERLDRYQHNSRIEVALRAPSATGDELVISLSDSLARKLEVMSSTPQPDGGGAGESGVEYRYKVADWSKTVHVAFKVLPEAMGAWSGTITAKPGNGAPMAVEVSQIVFP